MIYGWGIFCDIALTWMSLDLTDDKSTLSQIMAWCHQVPSHYLSQCWLSSMLQYGVTRPQWFKYHGTAHSYTKQTTFQTTKMFWVTPYNILFKRKKFMTCLDNLIMSTQVQNCYIFYLFNSIAKLFQKRVCLYFVLFTGWGKNKMAAVLQTTFWILPS